MTVIRSRSILGTVVVLPGVHLYTINFLRGRVCGEFMVRKVFTGAHLSRSILLIMKSVLLPVLSFYWMALVITMIPRSDVTEGRGDRMCLD